MLTVLIVDDSATDRGLAGGLLKREGGFQVDYAEDSCEPLAQRAVQVPDFMLTNLNMLEILMTDRGSEEPAIEALQQGAARNFPKRQIPPDSERRIQVSAQIERDVAESVIRDEGPGFDPWQLPDPTDPTNLNARAVWACC